MSMCNINECLDKIKLLVQMNYTWQRPGLRWQHLIGWFNFNFFTKLQWDVVIWYFKNLYGKFFCTYSIVDMDKCLGPYVLISLLKIQSCYKYNLIDNVRWSIFLPLILTTFKHSMAQFFTHRWMSIKLYIKY